MASAGDVIDEEIRVAGSPTEAVRRIITVVEAARSHQVVVEAPTVYRLVRRYRPAWAVPLLVLKSTESCAVHVNADRAPAEGGTLRLVGRLPRTALAAIRLAAEEPPRYAPPARDARWRTGDADWAPPASAPATPMPYPSTASGPFQADLSSTMQIPVVPATEVPADARTSPTGAYPAVSPATLPPADPAPATLSPATLSPATLSPADPAPATATPASWPDQRAGEPSNWTVPRPRAVATARPAYAVLFDTGEQVRLDVPVIVGRAPALQPGEPGRLLPINDPDFSISKTHLAVGADVDGPWVMDRHSLNGTAIVRSEGEIACPPGERVLVALGDTVYFGNRRFTLRALSGDAG